MMDVDGIMVDGGRRCGKREKGDDGPVSKEHQIQPGCGKLPCWRGTTGRPNLSRETKFLGENGDREEKKSLFISTDRLMSNLP